MKKFGIYACALLMMGLAGCASKGCTECAKSEKAHKCDCQKSGDCKCEKGDKKCDCAKS